MSVQEAPLSPRFNGLSGATLRLVRVGAAWVVRKSAGAGPVAERLIRQIKRQKAYAAAIGDVVRIPRILDENVTPENVSFDMEFVRGIDGITALREGGFDDVRRMTRGLCELLREESLCPPITGMETVDLFEAILGRVCQVQESTGAMNRETLGAVLWQLTRLRGIGRLSATLCHGDLTFENIIVDDGGRIWLVDFLDGPLEHWWQDVVKLDQDLSGGWFQRNSGRISPGVLQFVAGELRRNTIAAAPAFRAVWAGLMTATFVRILPYVTSDADRMFVLSRVSYFSTKGDPE